MSGNSSKVAEFKQHCDQMFQDDAGGKSSLVALEGLVEQDMANTYKIPVSPILPVNSSANKDKQSQLRGLWHQLTQHLVDLRYISEQDFLSYQGHKKEILQQRSLLIPIVRGVDKYLRQETAVAIRALINSNDPGPFFTQFWIEQHLAAIIEAIAKYTSFDGSLVPPDDYEVGEDSCYGRSLAFRMRVIFAMDEALDDADIFDRSMIKYTISLDNILKLGSQPSLEMDGDELKEVTIPVAFWEQVCDLDQLFDAFFTALPTEIQGKAYAITYRYTKAEETFTASDYELIYQDRPAVNNSGNSPKWTVGRINKAERLKAGIYANIACRLLQLKLWQTSFYLGAIDGDWGAMSHEAVLDAYHLELNLWEKGNKAHVKKKKFKKYSKRTVKRSVFRKEKKGIIAIDLEDMHQILQNYVSTVEEESAAGENEMAIIEELRKKTEISDEKLDRAILNEKSLDKCYTTASGSPKRRVSYVSMKNKSFFKGLLRGIGKIVSWIIGAFKKVLGLIFSFAKAIIDRIRKGFQLFAKGFRYLSHLLLGRPIVAPRKNPEEQDTVPIFTRFQLDFDAINFIPKSASTAALKAHMATLDMMRKSMIFFIDVVLFVIKAISKLAQPGGWVSLGIIIFRWLFQRMGELFREEPQHEWSSEVA
ncbi:MAG: hypothetical protein KTR30_24005 [Saprospiraceae bacterium]|nr:hypothetical protein [Saprospiraceae bacterium]